MSIGFQVLEVLVHTDILRFAELVQSQFQVICSKEWKQHCEVCCVAKLKRHDC